MFKVSSTNRRDYNGNFSSVFLKISVTAGKAREAIGKPEIYC